MRRRDRVLLVVRRDVRRGTARVPPEEMWVASREAPLRVRVGVAVTPGRRRPVVVLLRIGQEEGHDARAAGHVILAQLPVHGLGGAPGNLHLFRHLGPHFGFEPVVGHTCESVIFRSLLLDRDSRGNVGPSHMHTISSKRSDLDRPISTGAAASPCSSNPRSFLVRGIVKNNGANSLIASTRRDFWGATHLSYSRASLFLRSSSHSLRLSR